MGLRSASEHLRRLPSAEVPTLPLTVSTWNESHQAFDVRRVTVRLVRPAYLTDLAVESVAKRAGLREAGRS